MFTGKDLTAEEEARLRSVAKSIVLKDVQSPERLLDETALFLHRVVADLPEHKRRMIESLHGSTEALRDRKVLVVDDDARNIFALTTVLDPARSQAANAAYPGADRQGDEGRPRKVPPGGRFGLHRQAGQHRTTDLPVAGLAIPMNRTIDLLIVDDEPRNLDALESILADPGYRLLRAADADTALKHLLGHDVAAIVPDIKMPGMSGFELAQMIKASKKFRQIPILFLTAYLVEDRDVIAGYGTGAVDYLTKPLNPQILRH